MLYRLDNQSGRRTSIYVNRTLDRRLQQRPWEPGTGWLVPWDWGEGRRPPALSVTQRHPSEPVNSILSFLNSTPDGPPSETSTTTKTDLRQTGISSSSFPFHHPCLQLGLRAPFLAVHLATYFKRDRPVFLGLNNTTPAAILSRFTLPYLTLTYLPFYRC